MSIAQLEKSGVINQSGEIIDSVSILSSKAHGWAGVNLEVHRVINVNSHSNISYSQPTIILPLFRTGLVHHRHNGVQKRYVFHPAQIGIFTSDFPHDCAPSLGCEFAELQMDQSLLIEKAREFDLTTGHSGIELVPTLAQPDMQLEYLCRAMIVELQEGATSGRLYADSLAGMVAFRILRHYSTLHFSRAKHAMHGVNARIKRALELMHDCIERDLSLTDLASAANMSTYHFARVFRSVTGQSPHQYLVNQRIEKAKHLLRETELKILEISVQTGFSTDSRLCTVFRRMTGVSPQDYRRIYRT